MEFMRFWLIRANTLLLELSTVANNSLMIHRINNPVFYQCFYFILFYFVKPSDNRILLNTYGRCPFTIFCNLFYLVL